MFRKGVIAVAVGTVLAVAIAFTLGWLVGLPSYDSEVLARSRPTLLYLGIVIAAGGINGYAKIETKISGSLAVTAISHNKQLCVYAIALMPPSV